MEFKVFNLTQINNILNQIYYLNIFRNMFYYHSYSKIFITFEIVKIINLYIYNKMYL